MAHGVVFCSIILCDTVFQLLTVAAFFIYIFGSLHSFFFVESTFVQFKLHHSDGAVNLSDVFAGRRKIMGIWICQVSFGHALLIVKLSHSGRFYNKLPEFTINFANSNF